MRNLSICLLVCVVLVTNINTRMCIIVFQNTTDALPAKLNYLVYNTARQKLSGKHVDCVDCFSVLESVKLFV